MRIMLIVLLALTVLVLGVAIAAGPQLRTALERITPKPPATKVRVERIASGELKETVSAPGEVGPDTQVDIAAVVSARIEELHVTDGDEVRKGDLLAKLDDRDLRTTLVSATARRDSEAFRLRSEQARLKGIESTLEFGRKEMERMATLYETGDVALRELDNAIERVRDLEATVNSTTHGISVIESSIAAAEAEIERAQEGLNNTVIRSPMDGIVTRRLVEVGEIVTGSTTNPGTIMMTVADLSRMILLARIPEADVAHVEVGQRCRIYVNAYPNEEFSGTVRQIALQRDGNADGTGYFPTEIEIDLRGRRLYSGLVANVDVEIATHAGLVVPYQSIVSRDVDELPEAARTSSLVDRTKRTTTVVYLLVDGKSVCTPVRAGASDLTHRIIRDGVEEGDMVVTGPYKVLDELKHDVDIAPMDADPATDAATDQLVTTEGGTIADAGAPEGAAAGEVAGETP